MSEEYSKKTTKATPEQPKLVWRSVNKETGEPNERVGSRKEGANYRQHTFDDGKKIYAVFAWPFVGAKEGNALKKSSLPIFDNNGNIIGYEGNEQDST